MKERHSCECPTSPVDTLQTGEIAARQIITVDHEEAGIEELTPGCERAGRAAQRWFRRVPDPRTPAAAVAKMGADAIRTMMKIDHQLSNALADERFNGVLQNRSTDDGNHWFWHGRRQRPKPSALACGENHRLHTGIPFSFTTLPVRDAS